MENLPNIYKHTLYKEKSYQYSECNKAFSQNLYIICYKETIFLFEVYFFTAK